MKLRHTMSVLVPLTGTFLSTSTANAAESPPPAMGWASWSSFAAKIDYNVIKTQADAWWRTD